MGCLEKRKEPRNIQDIPEEENFEFKLIEDLNVIPKDRYLCPKCHRVPEILGIHPGNGSIELKCKHDDKKIIKINEYFKEVKESNFLGQCEACNKAEADIKYCYECKMDLCKECINTFDDEKIKHKKKHLDTCIDLSEKNNKCLKHYLEEVTEYCKDCEENVCPKERKSRHEEHEIIKINDSTLSDENSDANCNFILNQNKILEQIIFFNQIIINTYRKNPNNYFHRKNLENVANSLKEQFKQKEKDIEYIDCLLKDLKRTKNIQKNANSELNKKDIDLTGQEEKLNLNNRGLNDEDLNLISKIKFTKLRGIDLSGNNITNLEFLNYMNLPHLEYIDLSYNHINDIKPIKNISKNIKDIYLQGNNEIDKSSKDFNDLKKDYNVIYEEFGIENFNAKYNLNLEEINEKTVKLEILDINIKHGEELLKDLYLIVPKINKIKRLILHNVHIKDFSLLFRLHLNYLEELDLAVNNITNLRFLNEINCKKLKILFLKDNKINDIAPLNKLIEKNYKNENKIQIISLSENLFLFEESKDAKKMKEEDNKNKYEYDDNIKKKFVKDKENIKNLENYERKGIILDIKKAEDLN